MLEKASLVQAVSFAVTNGYELEPDALRLLAGSGRGSAELVQIVAYVIDEKARKGRGSGDERLISYQDLCTLVPDLVEGIAASAPPSQGAQKESAAEITAALEAERDFEIIEDPTEKIAPGGLSGFSYLFKSRYEKLGKIFSARPEGRQVVKISEARAMAPGKKESAKVMGLVMSKRNGKSGVELTLDDDSGRATIACISEDAKKQASALALDECVLVEVEKSSEPGPFICKRVIEPDVPNRLGSTSKKNVYAVLTSDLHIGSEKFLDGAFERFLDWLSGRAGDEEIVGRIRYLIIGGDVVDGVGVFPLQEYELRENNILKQYEMVFEKLQRIPSHIKVLIVPGNHDSTRQALPQPMIPKKYAEGLHALSNVTMLGDPCVVKLNGVRFLVFHGRSLDDVLATTPGLSYERPSEAMKVLLKARHLAPMFGSRTPIAPEVEDYLVIGEPPDVFHAGHVHTVGCENYRGTLIVNSGTWQGQTGYQSNLGISPRPGLVPVVNLGNLEVTFRDFLLTRLEEASTGME